MCATSQWCSEISVSGCHCFGLHHPHYFYSGGRPSPSLRMSICSCRSHHSISAISIMISRSSYAETPWCCTSHSIWRMSLSFSSSIFLCCSSSSVCWTSFHLHFSILPSMSSFLILNRNCSSFSFGSCQVTICLGASTGTGLTLATACWIASLNYWEGGP